MHDTMESNIKRLQEEKKILEEKIKSLEEEKRNAKVEKDNAVKGLSQRMENQMTENKTSIDNLSDQNRPSKLGERYTMLYDNQWLHAFEVLSEKHKQNEENAVQILLNILTECHNFAKLRVDQQMKDIVQIMSGDRRIEIGEEVKRHLRSAIKLMNVTRDDVLFQECENHVRDVMGSVRLYLYEKEMKSYLTECIQLCWLMVIQDPPLVLGKKATKWEQFDHDLYKYYTVSGKLVEFVVLPPLFLGDGGTLLSQGVAQPILYTEKQITKNAWNEGGETNHRNQLTRTTMKPDHIEPSPVTPKTKADDIPKVRKHEPNHRLTTEHTEASTSSSSSTLSSPPNRYAAKVLNAQSAINPTGETDKGYQMQPVKTSYAEINFASKQKQNATSQYEKSGDQISIGKSMNHSEKTRSSDVIKQQNWSHEKSTNPTTFQTRGTDRGYELLRDTERVRYETFVRTLKEDGEKWARKVYPFTFERYYHIYLAS